VTPARLDASGDNPSKRAIAPSQITDKRQLAVRQLGDFRQSIARGFTNGRGSDVDGPIRHAKPDRRTHTQEVPHTRAVPHRPDIHQPPLAAALQ
jgi:hypothetical protein